MEIFCRNVPDNLQDKHLKKALAPALNNLGIYNYHCKKFRGKGAALTIGDLSKAKRFLEEYGDQPTTSHGGENLTPTLAAPPQFDGAAATLNPRRAQQKILASEQAQTNHVTPLQAQMDALTIQHTHNNRPNPRTVQIPAKPHEKGQQNARKPQHARQPQSQRKKIINILGKVLYFAVSRNEPDEFLLRSLRDEVLPPNPRSRSLSVANNQSHRQQKSFLFASFSCGSWDYKDKDPVFVNYFQDARMGSLHFGKRLLKVELESPMLGHCVEFDYSSMAGPIYFDNSARATLTITMEIAPRFFEVPLWEIMLASLQMSTSKKRKGQRCRVDNLGPSYNGAGATCFTYRIQLRNVSDIQQILNLKKRLNLPDIDFWRTRTFDPALHYIAEMEKFMSKLTVCDLPFRIKFQLQSLVSNGVLPANKVLDLVSPARMLNARVGTDQTILAIQRLARNIPYAGPEAESSGFDSQVLVKSLLYYEDNPDEILDWSLTGDVTAQPHRVAIHRATITPTGILLFGPTFECKNRVLRRFPPHHFIRVEIAEESGDSLKFDPTASLYNIYNDRFRKLLEAGLNIGGKVFEFLGFSHSSLRSQSCWFMAPFEWTEGRLGVRTIIPLLGDFTGIQSPAKYAARLGQTFSDTLTSIPISQEIIQPVPDVERNGRVFSDGSASISKSVMHKIWKEYALHAAVKPTVFQIRLAGAKGMLSYNSSLQGDLVTLRPSMIKFNVQDWNIEICGAGIRSLPMYLNRQLIKILEDLGVPPEPFINMQQDEVEVMRLTAKSPVLTARFLEHSHVAKSTHLAWLLRAMGNLNIQYSDDDFLKQAIQLAVLVKLRELKYRARITVKDGATLYGIVDETGFLEEGQVFVAIQKDNGGRFILKGDNIIITRSPALHPGDIQFVNAVDVPDNSPLHQLHNCVVFSQKGDRDLPSKLSGGDLDGDLYNVIWDESIRPKFAYKPADYPRVPELVLDRPVERSDVIGHFLTFMQQDQLGRIANVHLIIADQSPQGTLDPRCLLLAELHSTAVDFSKTGIPADVSQIPKYPRCRPDFMAPGPRVQVAESLVTLQNDAQFEYEDDDEDEGNDSEHRYYKSHKVLGELFRQIDEVAFLNELEKSLGSPNPNGPGPILELWEYAKHESATILWDHLRETATGIMEIYDDNLLHLMHRYSVTTWKGSLTEVEVFIGHIIGKNDGQTKRSREASVTMREEYDHLVQQIVSQIRNYAEGKSESLERSIACFAVAMEKEKEHKQDSRLPSLQSFKWIAAALCLQEIDKMANVPKSLLKNNRGYGGE